MVAPRGYLLTINIILVVQGAVHLAKDLEVRLAGEYGGAVNGVVHHVVLDTVHDDDLVVVRQGGHKGTCRRNDGRVCTGSAHSIEDAVLVEVVRSCVSVALNQSKLVCKFVCGESTGAVQCIVCISCSLAGIVLCDDQVLACNGVVVIKHGIVGTIGVAVVSEPDGPEDGPVDCCLQRSTKRRTADYVAATVRTVIDAVVIVVVDAPMAYPAPAGRDAVDPVPIVVRMIGPEVTGTVPRHGVTVTGCYTMQVVTVVNAIVVVVTVVVSIVTISVALVVCSLVVVVNNTVGGKTASGDVGGTYCRRAAL